jgi:cobalt-precorrin 5A hydrolase
MPELAVVALTPWGTALAQRLVAALGRGEVVPVAGSVRETLHDLFTAGRPLVCIMALGIVVRILGPLVRGKEDDPPVVVVDDAGRFAVSVLGGHVAGANQLAHDVGRAIGALPVITTGSDALGLPAIDLIGREWGWTVERKENLARVGAAVVGGKTIGVYQEAGRQDWWQAFGEWPKSFQWVCTWPPQGQWAGLLAITDRWLPGANQWPVVVYRPRTLVLGVGCRRGVPADEIETLFQYVCQSRGFSPLSLWAVATADIKAHEPGLREFAEQHRVGLHSYSVAELAAVPNLPTPSEKVRAKVGTRGVAEPAAMLAAGATSLLMPKYRGQRITMALARREEA